MVHVHTQRSILGLVIGLLEHTAFVVAGFVLMVLGLGLGVTMVMLPVGLVIGLLGFAMFVGGLTVRMQEP
jgi:membrane-bound ClpP family serine protease